ncbi:hypothetical protein FRB95_005263 [Tulasnella sp. JGI-2019a]|nr:hypothetical protein FRB93_004311 [Tulasnella sp. JGI-2019a]KAG9029496.1 hypothetical protein FRB95_005263 [Tulasnella sp. JGI-2019a]
MLDDRAGIYMIAIMTTLLLWGLYTRLFVATIIACRRKGISWFAFPVVVISFIFMCKFGQSTYKGFVLYPDGPTTYFTLFDYREIDQGWNTSIDFWQCAASIASDLLMMWRVFIIWSRNKRVLYLPIVLILFEMLGCMMILVFNIMFVTHFEDPVFAAHYNTLVVVLLSNIIAETWYSTGLICYRLWSVDRQKRRVATAFHEELSAGSALIGRYGRIMRILVQSGMLHSLELVAFITSIILIENPAAADIINSIHIRIIGIAATLVIWQSNTVPETEPINISSPPTSVGYSMPVFFRPSGTADVKDQSAFVVSVTGTADADGKGPWSTVSNPL